MNRFTTGAGLVAKVALVGSSVALLGAACWQGVGTNTNVGLGNVGVNENTNTVVDNANTGLNVNVNGNTNTNSTGEIDTSDWLTYTNEEYGFSFRYPSDWVITEATDWDCVELTSSELVQYNKEWQKKNKDVPDMATDAVKTYDINICRKDNSNNLPLNSWIEENVDSAWIVSKNDVRFDDIDSIEIVTNALGVWRETYTPANKSIIRVSRLIKPIAIDSDVVEEITATVELIH